MYFVCIVMACDDFYIFLFIQLNFISVFLFWIYLKQSNHTLFLHTVNAQQLCTTHNDNSTHNITVKLIWPDTPNRHFPNTTNACIGNLHNLIRNKICFTNIFAIYSRYFNTFMRLVNIKCEQSSIKWVL